MCRGASLAPPGSRDTLSTMKRFLAPRRLLGQIPLLLGSLLLAGPAAAVVDSGPNERVLREASKPGAFCPPSGCRARNPSAFSAATFGAAVVAIGWQARRRESSEA